MNLSADWLMQAALRATLVLGGLFMLWRFLPVTRPALRRQVLLWISAAVLTAPWLAGWWAVGAFQTPEAAGTAAPRTDTGIAWPALTAALWLGGTALAVARLGRQAWSLRCLIRRARPWAGPPSLTDVTALHSPAITGPCVAGSRKPVLLLPDSARDWTPSQWQMVLAHETQHLRQQDLRLAWLPRLVLCLYWWHPVAHWLNRQFHAESEALCDRAVLVRSGQGPREYVEFLLSLNGAHQPAHSAGMALKSSFGKRLERLLSTRRPAFHGPVALAALLILTGVAILSFSLKTVAPSPAPPSVAADTALGATTDSDDGESVARETALRLSANPFPEP
jgi:hypothetical protein